MLARTFLQNSNELMRNTTSLGEELICIAKELDWLNDEEVKELPGSIAFEYASFKTLMRQGSIAESCWKITNLCEVIVSYLWATCIEQGKQLKSLRYKKNIISFNIKLNEVQSIYPELIGLLTSMREIMNWRNRYGIGHGSLVRDYSVYVESLAKYTANFLKELKELPVFLNKQHLSLYNSKGTALVGRNYHSLLNCYNRKERFYTRSELSGNIINDPIRSLAYQMDSPDIYFFVGFVQDGTCKMYRNYAQNRAKYIKINGEICWDEDWDQVSLLNEAEFDDWLKSFKEKEKGKVFQEKILSVAEMYQEHGMYAETKKCLRMLEEISEQNKLKEWVDLLEFAYNTALDNYVSVKLL
ncbi:MAG: hypothetical protein GX357_09195 [Firmicutes bacterium]|nr:hypothetical protein [Bacillota bacterium]